MGVVIRQSFFSSVFAFIGVAIGYINAVILMPKFLTQEQVGTIRTITSLSMFMIPFIMFGLNGALLKYYPKINGQHKQGLVNFVFLTVGLIFSLLLTIGYLGIDFLRKIFEENAAAINDYIPEIVLLTGLMTLFTLLTSFSKSNLDITTPNLIREVGFKVFHSMLLFAVGFSILRFNEYVQGQVILFFLLSLILALYVIRTFGFSIGISGIKNLPGKAEIMTLSAFTLFGGAGRTIALQVDQLMVSKYISLSSNAIYSTAMFMAMVVYIPKKFVAEISVPIITKAFHQNDHKAINQHYKKASLNHLILGSFLLTGIVTNLHNIYAIMPNGELYESGIIIVIILGLAKLLDMVFSLNAEILYLSNYYKYVMLFIVILGAGTVLTNLWLIPIYGAKGAAYATLITYALYNLSQFAFIKWKFGFSPFTRKTFEVSLILIVLYFGIDMLPLLKNPYLDILMRGIITVVLYAGYIMYFRPSLELFETFMHLKNRFLKLLK